MTEIIGLIETAINLAEKLRQFVQHYADGPKNASRMHLFSGQINVVRLELLRTALKRNEDSLKFTKDQVSRLKKAARELGSELETATKYFKDRAPEDFLRRLS